LLERTLAAVARLETGGKFTFSVVVCDNDQDQTAQPIIERFKLNSSLEIVYCVEPQQNISLARNRALANSTGEFVAFIDDDEFPLTDWLQRLLTTCEVLNVAGVLGPVRPHFDDPPPRWVLRGRFCERPEHPSGTPLSWRQTRTGNVLFRRSILQSLDQPFRPEFGSGGEDQDFFRRLIEKGYRFVWCNEAVVHEVVPGQRLTRSYMLRRAFLRGQNERHHLTFGGVVKSLFAAPIYAAVLAPVLIFGEHHFMTYAMKFLDHFGKLLSALGIRLVGEKYLH
jgi:glycosyltransferase involved in cell wall biosynthesis